MPACSIGRTLDTFSDPWAFGILVEAFFGTRRFQAFRANTDYSKATLSKRLARLVERGIFRKVRYSMGPERYEYRLTSKGKDLFPVLLALAIWGSRWIEGVTPIASIGLVHRLCGRVVEPAIVCSACREPLDVEQVSYRSNPDSGWDSAPTDKRGRRSSRSESLRRQEVEAVGRAIDLVGDRWSVLVVREALFGVSRFDEFRERLGIARNILSDRLKRLSVAGIFLQEGEGRQRQAYVLTEKGKDLFFVLAVMMRWGDLWLNRASMPPVTMVHHSCSKEFHAVLMCRSCEEDVEATAVIHVPGVQPRAAAGHSQYGRPT